MKKIKTFIAAIGLVLFGFVLGTCGMTAKAEQSYPLKIWKQNDNGMCKTWNVIDALRWSPGSSRAISPAVRCATPTLRKGRSDERSRS